MWTELDTSQDCRQNCSVANILRTTENCRRLSPTQFTLPTPTRQDKTVLSCRCRRCELDITEHISDDQCSPGFFDDIIFVAKVSLEWEINQSEVQTTLCEVFCFDKLWYVRALEWCIIFNVHCVQEKKETNIFFVIPLTKLGELWWNLVYSFLNKFATKSCKRFPPHLNNVSTLPCETWNAIELLDRETPEFIQPQLWPENSPDLNPVDNTVWKILQERYTKHASLICSYRPRHWRMAAAMTTWSSLVHSLLTRCFSSSRSVMHVLYTFSCSIPTRCINSIQIWRI